MLMLLYTNCGVIDREGTSTEKEEEGRKEALDENKVVSLVASNFQAFVEKPFAVVFFHAPWCTKCSTKKGLLNDLADTLPNMLAHVNCQNAPYICKQFAVKKLPSWKVFQSGAEVTTAQIDSSRSAKDIERAIQQFEKGHCFN